MPDITTEIEVKADPRAVWDVVSDVDSYSDWNPFITRCRGELRTAETLDMIVKPNGGNAEAATATVINATPPGSEDPPFELRWTNTSLFGLIQREYTTRIVANHDDSAVVRQEASFSGPLAMFKSSELEGTERALQQMNIALSDQVEKSAA